MTDAQTPTQDDHEAADRYKRFCRFDPYPSIAAALLNSAD
jgi:hypothetical protein